jgi:signal transduction histidine kinase
VRSGQTLGQRGVAARAANLGQAQMRKSQQPAAARILGQSTWAALMGRTLASLRAGPVPAEPGWELRREHVLRRADGEEFFASFTVSPLPGKRDHRIIILRDISELKAADRAKNEFISTVSHELRTPLTSIRGSLGLLLGGALGAFPEKAGRMLEVANRNAVRLSQLIDDLLDLEKMSAGSMSFNVASVPADPMLAAAASANEGYALRQDVELRVAGQCHDNVQADELRLQQVFANLISNAIKYSPRGGVVELGAEVDGDCVRFTVRDHGSGIPEAFRGRIFQPFSQADSSDVRARGGTGLGLNISRGIVESLGGDIGFDTAASGTTFYFRLPRLPRRITGGPADSPSAGAPAPSAPTASTDVLVLSSRPEAASAIGHVLAATGLRCPAASTPARPAR